MKAVDAYREILADDAKPGYFASAKLELADFGLGDALRGQRHYDEAAQAYEQAASAPGVGPELKIRSLLAAGQCHDLNGERALAVQRLPGRHRCRPQYLPRRHRPESTCAAPTKETESRHRLLLAHCCLKPGTDAHRYSYHLSSGLFPRRDRSWPSFCQRCGTGLPMGARFCSNCGAVVPAAAAYSRQAAHPAACRPPDRRGLPGAGAGQRMGRHHGAHHRRPRPLLFQRSGRRRLSGAPGSAFPKSRCRCRGQFLPC